MAICDGEASKSPIDPKKEEEYSRLQEHNFEIQMRDEDPSFFIEQILLDHPELSEMLEDVTEKCKMYDRDFLETLETLSLT